MGKWSRWVAVADLFQSGWNPGIPIDKFGVYRFRVSPMHSDRAGEGVYLGRAGSHDSNADTAMALCMRVERFITSCMGFWSVHGGGETFFKQAHHGLQHLPVHQLSVRDLDVSWAVDEDPMCREAEELFKLPCLPVFNKKPPRT